MILNLKFSEIYSSICQTIFSLPPSLWDQKSMSVPPCDGSWTLILISLFCFVSLL